MRDERDLVWRTGFNREAAVNAVDFDRPDLRRRPLTLNCRDLMLSRRTARDQDRGGQRADSVCPSVHRHLRCGLRKLGGMVSVDGSQTRILRIAAFLVDALTIALVLVLPTSLISYALAWIGGSVKGIQIVWWVALAILVLSILVRDGIRGRSVGK